MTTSEFAYICKHPEIIAAQYIQPLEETTAIYPFCQSGHILTAKFYEDIDESSAIAQRKLQRAALYCTDRAMLKAIIDRDPAHVIESRRDKSGLAPSKSSSSSTKQGRSKKINTSVIHTSANPAKVNSPTVVEKVVAKSIGLNVRVPEIILPNERLIPLEKSEPFEHQELHIKKSKQIEGAGFIPVTVNQPVGDKLFTELYNNLRELRQRKKKVMLALDKLAKPSEISEIKVRQKLPAGEMNETKPVTKVVSQKQDASKVKEEVKETPKKQTSIPVEAKSAVTEKQKGEQTSKQVKKVKAESKGKVDPKPKTQIQSKAVENPDKNRDKQTHLQQVGKEQENVDETDLLLAYLQSLKHEEPVEQPKPQKRPVEGSSALDSQHHLIDQFLKDLPNIKTRDLRQSDTQHSQNDLSEASTTQSHFVSENLAKIYLRQGNLEKAKETFSKLMLKYPEKSDYFAAELKKLEE